MHPHELARNPLHLGRGATAIVQPEFDGEMSWYERYMERHGSDGAEGRLVTMHTFRESWDSWEVHPNGHEVVLCTSGEITLHQEHADGSTATVALVPGEYAINEPGVWHTADVAGEASAVFITAGLGTMHRTR